MEKLKGGGEVNSASQTVISIQRNTRTAFIE